MSIDTSQLPLSQPLASYTYARTQAPTYGSTTTVRSQDDRVYTIATDRLPNCLHKDAGEFVVIKAEVNSSTICTISFPPETAKIYVPPFIQTVVSLQTENKIFQNIGIG